ncbi:unnamed protein product [Allacma fusca]|uniref:Uncharacterized protein n=1 Tax=Allacma fusca TaxID=39272 RepID=A0A8J2M8C8_9HEXA|nr:unnamed protein product [Allacma fusca]
MTFIALTLQDDDDGRAINHGTQWTGWNTEPDITTAKPVETTTKLPEVTTTKPPETTTTKPPETTTTKPPETTTTKPPETTTTKPPEVTTTAKPVETSTKPPEVTTTSKPVETTPKVKPTRKAHSRSINPRRSPRKKNREYQRYKPRKRGHAEFVSLRCGIGAHWEASTKKCIPHDHDGSEETKEVSEESMELEPKKNKIPSISAEEIVGHIVSLYCGIGYSYNEQDHKCTPLSKEP